MTSGPTKPAGTGAMLHPPTLIALTLLAAAALYLIGNGRMSLWDRDEPRYAQCSRQMLLGSPGPDGHPPDWIVPRFLDGPRYEKPPFIYWCQLTAMKLFGDNTFAARFPSSIAMLLVLGLVGVACHHGAGAGRAPWAVFILASSALTIMSAKMCLTDAVLLLWVTGSQLCLFAMYRGNRAWWLTVLFWSLVGLGGLTKGPIVLATLLATMIALAAIDFTLARPRTRPGSWGERLAARFRPLGRPAQAGATWAGRILELLLLGTRDAAVQWWGRTRPLVGLPILVAIVGPWLYLVEHRSPGFLAHILATANRHLSVGTEKHLGPPGYYLGLIWGLFFPWCLLLPTTLAIAWRHRDVPHLRYALAAIIGPWVFQEIMKTKLPFYVLPTFPPLALLTADALVRCLNGEHDDVYQPKYLAAVAVWAIAAVGLACAPWLLALPELQLGPQPWVVLIALSVIGVAYGVTVLALFRARRPAVAAVAMGLGAMLLFGTLLAAYLPNAPFLRLPNQVAAVLRREGATHAGDARMVQYKEPGLAFYQGGTLVEERDDHFLDKPLQPGGPRWVVLPRDLWEQATPRARADWELVPAPVMRGANYAGKIGGKQIIEVVVARRRVAPAP